MRKKSVLFCAILLLCLLSACSFFAPNFGGTIEDIDGDTAIVKIEEGEILKSGDKAVVDLSVVRNHDFQIGDKVKVEYGYVRESSPLKIDTIYVKPAN